MKLDEIKLLVCLLAVQLQASDGSKTSIAFLALSPFAADDFEDPDLIAGPAVTPAVRLAVDRINSRTDVLPGITVQLLMGNSGCDIITKTALSFTKNVFHGPVPEANVVGIIGPACSEAATYIGALSARDEVSMIQISAAMSPELRDIDTYKNTFRMTSSSLYYSHIILDIIDRTQWENVFVLCERTRPYFTTTCQYLLNETSATVGEIDDAFVPLSRIAGKYKMVVLVAGSALAQKIMCLAYHYQPKLIYPVYQWILFEKSSEQFLIDFNFTFEGSVYTCTKQMMKESIEAAITVLYRVQRQDSPSSVVDLAYPDYNKSYHDYRDEYLLELEPTQRRYEKIAEVYAVAYYDATWALALSLNSSFRHNFSALASYKHGNPSTTSVIRDHLSKLKFEGLLGRIEFQKNIQEVSTIIDIYQTLDGRSVPIGNHNGSNEETTLSETAIFLPDTFSQRITSIHPAATLLVLIFTILITILVVGLHVMFIFYSEERSIKAASPELSQIIFSGCYLLLLQVLLNVVEHSHWLAEANVSHKYVVTVGIFCNTGIWLNNLSIGLIMGTLCCHMWRIYRIFHHFHTKEILISNATLTGFIICLVVTNSIALIIWTTLNPLLVQFEQQSMEYPKMSSKEPVIVLRAVCSCQYFGVWLLFAYFVNILVIVCVMVLATLNRRVTRRHFRTAKSINIMVYFITSVLVVCIALALVFDSLAFDIHFSYMLWQISSLFIIFTVCILYYFPRVLPVLAQKYISVYIWLNK